MNLDEIVIDRGSHKATTGACVMEWVWLLSNNKYNKASSIAPIVDGKSDRPTCTFSILTSIAIIVNDRLNTDNRQRLRHLIPRLLQAQGPKDLTKEKRVAVRLAIYSAKSVLHLVRDGEKEACNEAIEAAEQYLTGITTKKTLNAAAYAAAAAANAAAAAYAAANAAYAAAAANANAAAAAAAAANAAVHIDLVMWLSDMIDAFEKAMVEEDCYLHMNGLDMEAIGGS